jgi:cytochrome b pre-mRNA-processing protein 3
MMRTYVGDNNPVVSRQRRGKIQGADASGKGSTTMEFMARLFRRASAPPSTDKATRESALSLYRAIVAQSRQPSFFSDFAVPDTPDGRFDMVMVHAALILRRLRRDHSVAEQTAQALFDLMFADMDENLREMGVGDLVVGKHIKGMAKAFYGRLAAYGEALDHNDANALVEAVRRNVYRGVDGIEGCASAISHYIREAAALLDETPIDRLLHGKVAFPSPPLRIGG